MANVCTILNSSLHFTSSDFDLRSTQLNAARHPRKFRDSGRTFGRDKRASTINRGRQEKKSGEETQKLGFKVPLRVQVESTFSLEFGGRGA